MEVHANMSCATTDRDRLGRACIVAAALMLAACGTPRPPSTLLHLGSAPATPPVTVATGSASFQLMLPVRLPDYLDRDQLLVPQGAPGTAGGATLVPIDGYRWAEPLREAVPRVLSADLSALLGPARLWMSPLPPGTVPQRQWRVEIQSFEPDAARAAVILRARWTLADANGARPALVQHAQIDARAADTSAAALAAAYRDALQRLAQRMVASAGP